MSISLDCSCPILPDAAVTAQFLANRLYDNLKDHIANHTVLTSDEIQGHLLKVPKASRDDVVWKLLLHLLVNDPSCATSPEHKTMALTLLHLCPTAAQIEDSHGCLLLHLQLLGETYDPELIYHVIMAFPQSVDTFAETELGKLNALQLAFARNYIDFKLIFFMLSQCPHAASCVLENGKTPLHLMLMESIVPASPDAYYYHTLKKLLVLHPRAAFLEITEELRVIRLQTFDVESNDRPGNDNNQSMFVMQRRLERWSPVDRARSMESRTEVRMIFDRFVHAMSVRRLRSQWICY
eukprot:scaffold622_cov174-Ochromonas_danica.AAC.4